MSKEKNKKIMENFLNEMADKNKFKHIYIDYNISYLTSMYYTTTHVDNFQLPLSFGRNRNSLKNFINQRNLLNIYIFYFLIFLSVL